MSASEIKADRRGDKHAFRVSVIVVTMNRKDSLAACLKSLSNQTFQDMEIVVVDNASSDGTGEMVSRLFPDIRYCYLNSNLGVGGGRNHGVRIASGEICIFIDDDACFENNNAIEQAISYFSHNSRLGCLAFRIIRPEDGREEYKSIPRVDKKVIDEDYECSYFCGAGFACPRRIFLEVGMFWESLFFIGEELDLSYRLLDQGYMILRSSAILVIHYETPAGQSSGKVDLLRRKKQVSGSGQKSALAKCFFPCHALVVLLFNFGHSKQACSLFYPGSKRCRHHSTEGNPNAIMHHPGNHGRD